MADDITITIDGQEIPAQPGQMINPGRYGRGNVHPLSLLLPGDETLWRVVACAWLPPRLPARTAAIERYPALRHRARLQFPLA